MQLHGQAILLSSNMFLLSHDQRSQLCCHSYRTKLNIFLSLISIFHLYFCIQWVLLYDIGILYFDRLKKKSSNKTCWIINKNQTKATVSQRPGFTSSSFPILLLFLLGLPDLDVGVFHVSKCCKTQHGACQIALFSFYQSCQFLHICCCLAVGFCIDKMKELNSPW